MLFSSHCVRVRCGRNRAALTRIGLTALALIFTTVVRGGDSVADAQAPSPPAAPSGTPAGEVTPPGDAPPAEPPTEKSGGAAETGSQVPPELIPPYIVRIYPVRPARLWKEVLDSLEAVGFPPEVTDDKGKVVK